jgi:hypothetical protein
VAGALVLFVDSISKRYRVWPEVAGMGVGASALLFLVAYTHRDTPACDDLRNQMNYCTSVHGQRYLYAGLALAIGSVVTFLSARGYAFLKGPRGGGAT